MSRQLCALALGAVCVFAGITQAAVYDDIFWVGGDGEWSGDPTATPSYGTGNWSTASPVPCPKGSCANSWPTTASCRAKRRTNRNPRPKLRRLQPKAARPLLPQRHRRNDW